MMKRHTDPLARSIQTFGIAMIAFAILLGAASVYLIISSIN